MANYEEHYQKSIDALTKLIQEKKEIPTEKEWNILAGENGYLTSQSLKFITDDKFQDLCRRIYKEYKKQEKEKKTNEHMA